MRLCDKISLAGEKKGEIYGGYFGVMVPPGSARVKVLLPML